MKYAICQTPCHAEVIPSIWHTCRGEPCVRPDCPIRRMRANTRFAPTEAEARSFGVPQDDNSAFLSRFTFHVSEPRFGIRFCLSIISFKRARPALLES